VDNFVDIRGLAGLQAASALGSAGTAALRGTLKKSYESNNFAALRRKPLPQPRAVASNLR